MKINELRQLSETELRQELLVTGKELFGLRMRRGVGQLTRFSLLKQAKRKIARIKTLLTQKNSKQEQ